MNFAYAAVGLAAAYWYMHRNDAPAGSGGRALIPGAVAEHTRRHRDNPSLGQPVLRPVPWLSRINHQAIEDGKVDVDQLTARYHRRQFGFQQPFDENAPDGSPHYFGKFSVAHPYERDLTNHGKFSFASGP
jgi:hypothetical protein